MIGENVWENKGPISHGEMLTAILQDRPDTAKHMMRGWATADLMYLARAARKLELLACAELDRRE
jgi:hypothetical protein